MGEAKRKRDRLSPLEQAGVDLTRKLANEGRLIEGGFAAWCMHRKVDVETDPNLPAMRDAYMSGAEHLWSSIMVTLDPGTEPTDRDLRRMDLMHAELDTWRAKKMAALAAAMPTKGSA